MYMNSDLRGTGFEVIKVQISDGLRSETFTFLKFIYLGHEPLIICLVTLLRTIGILKVDH